VAGLERGAAERGGSDEDGAMTVAVKLDAVRKRFGEGEAAVDALRGVTLEIRHGRMAAVVGPSGSGKTTLLNVIGGLEAPDAGGVCIDGTDIAQADEKALSRFRRANVGFVFQRFNLQPDLTVCENVELPLVLNRMAGSARRARVDEVLKKLGLDDRRRAFPVELSAGQEQRAAVARAIVHRPKLVLADEPTASLDGANAAVVMELLRRLVDEDRVTVVLATHDREMSAFADIRVMLRDGAVAGVETGRTH
jgi:putative ABC transport system ATP-binding protein